MAASRMGVLIYSIAAACAQMACPDVAAARRVVVTVDEGTELAVQRTPDGATLLLDLQGIIWSMPISGGPARRLTPDLMEMINSHLSPDGKWLAVQAYIDGKRAQGDLFEIADAHGISHETAKAAMKERV